MKKGLTELVFVLDRSGSMAGLESDVIGGYNRVLREHRQMEGEALVSTVLFDHERAVLHDRVPISCVEPLTEQDYTVRGSTALVDAIGYAIHHIGRIHKYARSEDVPEHTIFVITTDGYENASRAYSAEEVRRMICREQEQYGWEFLFLGANIDAVQTAEHFGIRRERAANFYATSEGTGTMFSAVCEASRSLRKCGSIRDDWSADLPKDSAE